jgi:hypothetical protein
MPDLSENVGYKQPLHYPYEYATTILIQDHYLFALRTSSNSGAHYLGRCSIWLMFARYGCPKQREMFQVVRVQCYWW